MRETHTMESTEYLKRKRLQRAVHYAACYFSIIGLGFLFACLIMGAVEYLFPLAVIMCALALIATITDHKELEVRTWKM